MVLVYWLMVRSIQFANALTGNTEENLTMAPLQILNSYYDRTAIISFAVPHTLSAWLSQTVFSSDADSLVDAHLCGQLFTGPWCQRYSPAIRTTWNPKTTSGWSSENGRNLFLLRFQGIVCGGVCLMPWKDLGHKATGGRTSLGPWGYPDDTVSVIHDTRNKLVWHEYGYDIVGLILVHIL